MNRQTLERQFSLPSSTPWKTFVVEAHPHEAKSHDFLMDVFGPHAVQDTEDSHLFEVAVSPDVKAIVDDLDGRFWSFHSVGPSEQLSRSLRARISSRPDLDYVWLPSEHLRNLRPGISPNFMKTEFQGWDLGQNEDIQHLSITVRGNNASQVIEELRSEHAVSIERLSLVIADPDFGTVEEGANRHAQFVAKGDSFVLHQRVVSDVVARYRRFVEAVEARALSFSSLGDDAGGRFAGQPIEIVFSRPLPNLPRFFDQLLSAREPFRLWGLFEASRTYAESDAVDLHVGQRLRLEADPFSLRIHLFEGCCGNSVARLVSCLQHYVDGALTLADPALAALLTLGSAQTSAA